jgi:hypothetical protein
MKDSVLVKAIYILLCIFGIKEELHNIIITTSEYNSSAQARYKSNRTESRKVKHLRSGSL